MLHSKEVVCGCGGMKFVGCIFLMARTIWCVCVCGCVVFWPSCESLMLAYCFMWKLYYLLVVCMVSYFIFSFFFIQLFNSCVFYNCTCKSMYNLRIYSLRIFIMSLVISRPSFITTIRSYFSKYANNSILEKF